MKLKEKGALCYLCKRKAVQSRRHHLYKLQKCRDDSEMLQRALGDWHICATPGYQPLCPLRACSLYECQQVIGPEPKCMALSSLYLVRNIIEWAAALGCLTSGQAGNTQMCFQLKKVTPSERGQRSLERNEVERGASLAEQGVYAWCQVRNSALRLLKGWGQGSYLGSSSTKGVRSLWSCKVSPSFSWNHRNRSSSYIQVYLSPKGKKDDNHPCTSQFLWAFKQFHSFSRIYQS